MHQKTVRVVVLRFGRRIYNRLENRYCSLGADRPPDYRMRKSVNGGYDIRSVFFSPTKLHNSSISTVGVSDGSAAQSFIFS